MIKHKQFRLLPLTAAVALVLAGQAAHAEDVDELEQLIRPTSQAAFGIGVVSEDNRNFGQFNGLAEGGAYPLVDFDLNRRDDETGVWTRAEGRDLGTDARELRFGQKRQGGWEYFVEYGELTRNHPYRVNTTLNGLGSNQQEYGSGQRDQTLRLDRERFKIGARTFLSPEVDLKLTYRHEEKSGDRAWGAQGAGFQANFLTEPVDYRHEEINAVLGYTTEKLQLSGGYLASLFGNQPKVLDNTTGQPELSLPLDNQSHQLYLNGGYSFTPTTRASFQAAYDRLTQDDAFFTPSDPVVVNENNLDGKVINTRLMGRLTSRPMDRLQVTGQLRYSDRDDRTPRRQFVTSTNSRRDGFNVPHSLTRTTGDVEATYSLPQGYALTAGVEREETERSAPPVRSTAYRTEVDETTYRLAVKRRLTERLGGSLAYLYSDRGGSDFLESGNDESARLDPINLADRQRDKVRLTLDWLATDALDVQLRYEQAWDDYDIRLYGPREGESRFASLDVGYRLNDGWQLTGWLSQDQTEIEQITRTGGGDLWSADLRHKGRALGLGLRGRTLMGLKMGADVQMSLDQSKHLIASVAGDESLPDIFYRRWGLTAFLEKPLSEHASLRLNYAYDRLTTDDWTWEEWTYNDGTTISQDRRDDVHFVGLTYQYRFW
ncbi:MtrB/PioB family decaheme-associated outer membrane protein [Halomonas sp. DQ26W]|uniref:MtrB/PioB family decaheme-associated outer membrane protein n=1 Tax=Halomonas sp. DQ26W TaxID=2282311 RepID=UPI0015F114FE|nr:MtrB/PioB family decaheme-associated outer membrane protein [Halomonas sp. DQ26W]